MTEKICIFTDAWHPQTNGVVVTLENTVHQCRTRGYEVTVISPDLFRWGFPLPGYSEIRLALPAAHEIRQMLYTIMPDHVHIATEGPVGQVAAAVCRQLGWHYTSSYHTQFPQYVKSRVSAVPESWIYGVLRWVHNSADTVLVTTNSVKQQLSDQGFDSQRLRVWGRGVDRDLFQPRTKSTNGAKILLNVGRVSPEKNLEAFLDMKTDSDVLKRVVGDGPDLDRLRNKYQNNPSISFVGKKTGIDLVREYQSADVFVFPSVSDTFGLVQIESIACGTPVAAYPVTGPIDVVEPGVSGALSWDLHEAVQQCLLIDRKQCAQAGEKFTWPAATDVFVDSLVHTRRET